MAEAWTKQNYINASNAWIVALSSFGLVGLLLQAACTGSVDWGAARHDKVPALPYKTDSGSIWCVVGKFQYHKSYKLKFELQDLRFAETNFETLSSGPRLGKTSMNESSWSAVEIEKFGAGLVGVWPVHLYVFIDGSWFGAGQIPSLIILLVTEHVWEIISFNYVLVFSGHVDLLLLVPGYMPMTNTWTWSLVKLRRVPP